MYVYLSYPIAEGQIAGLTRRSTHPDGTTSSVSMAVSAIRRS